MMAAGAAVSRPHTRGIARMQPPLSKVFVNRGENRMRELAAEEAEGREELRRDLDGDEAEALATRHAEERRARREAAEHEAPKG
jgi:hypothetical protein